MIKGEISFRQLQLLVCLLGYVLVLPKNLAQLNMNRIHLNAAYPLINLLEFYPSCAVFCSTKCSFRILISSFKASHRLRIFKYFNCERYFFKIRRRVMLIGSTCAKSKVFKTSLSHVSACARLFIPLPETPLYYRRSIGKQIYTRVSILLGQELEQWLI